MLNSEFSHKTHMKNPDKGPVHFWTGFFCFTLRRKGDERESVHSVAQPMYFVIFIFYFIK
jgi:hypothetical protein